MCASSDGVSWRASKRFVLLASNGLDGFADSDWAVSLSHSSKTGSLVLFNCSPISWKTKLQKYIALSTVEAAFSASRCAERLLRWFISDATCVWIGSAPRTKVIFTKWVHAQTWAVCVKSSLEAEKSVRDVDPLEGSSCGTVLQVKQTSPGAEGRRPTWDPNLIPADPTSVNRDVLNLSKFSKLFHFLGVNLYKFVKFHSLNLSNFCV